VLGRIPEVVDEVILVDSSTDGTAEIAQKAYPPLILLTEKVMGKGAALRAGFEAARGDIIVIIDADGSMDPIEIPRYVALLDDGFDFVKGSRHLEGGGSDDFTFIRSFGNTGLRMLANALYSARFTDLCYGYLAFHRRHLSLLAPSAVGFDIEAELVLRAKRMGLRITEVPTYEAERRSGASKLNALHDGWRILQRIMRERSAIGGSRPALDGDWPDEPRILHPTRLTDRRELGNAADHATTEVEDPAGGTVLEMQELLEHRMPPLSAEGS